MRLVVARDALAELIERRRELEEAIAATQNRHVEAHELAQRAEVIDAQIAKLTSAIEAMEREYELKVERSAGTLQASRTNAFPSSDTRARGAVESFLSHRDPFGLRERFSAADSG